MDTAKHDRPPVVAVVGHIDHGKSTLQQALREVSDDLNEAGSITQHIGAYEVHTTYEGTPRRCTVIDTPGHNAFSDIRTYSTNLADIAILVISSEEGYAEQTGESLRAIQKSGIPYIVAFTKSDSPKSDIESAKMSVLKNGVLLEGLGGDTPWVSVSAKTGQGIRELIDLLFLTVDVYEIVGHRTDGSIGTLLEVEIDTRAGIAGTVLLLDGELSGKRYISVGTSVAPLRILENDRGERLESATPSTPVRVVGFDTIPPLGEPVFLHEGKKEATQWVRTYAVADSSGDTVDTVEAEHIIPIVVRANTASGIQSIVSAIKESVPSGIAFKVIRSAVGSVSEEDVRTALAEKNGVVVGFHTDIDGTAQTLSERNPGVLLTFDTIYEIIDWAKQLSAKEKEEYQMRNITGSGKVIRIFSADEANGVYIVGIQVTEGVFEVGQRMQVVRNGSPAASFTIETLEQRNQSVSQVEGVKTQFATKVTGEGNVSLDDVVQALPTI